MAQATERNCRRVIVLVGDDEGRSVEMEESVAR